MNVLPVEMAVLVAKRLGAAGNAGPVGEHRLEAMLAEMKRTETRQKEALGALNAQVGAL